MKKLLSAIVLLILVVIIFFTWKIFGPGVQQPAGKYFYINTGSTYTDVLRDLQQQGLVGNTRNFKLASKLLKYNLVKAGKYQVSKGMSTFNLVRMLKNGSQTPVDLVIVKFRTKEEFAGRIGKEFETDSLQMIQFLNNNDSLRHYGVDSSTWACVIVPDTYRYFWNSTPTKIFEKLQAGAEKFWTTDKKQKVASNGLTTTSAYIIASIIDEETNKKSDKGNIASVYINRLSKGMPLQADPTIKFAMKDFGLKRIYQKYLLFESPYNTYTNKGLPPGPICTPSVETLTEVINAPKTDYIYFVADSDLNGGSVFTSDYADHMKFARLYQQSLDRQDSIRKSRQSVQ